MFTIGHVHRSRINEGEVSEDDVYLKMQLELKYENYLTL
jgi:hypothetical protein